GVTWSLTGADSGTGISSAGLLTISPAQTASLTVVARSRANTDVSKTAAVTVKQTNDITDITITGELDRTAYYRGTPIDMLNLAGLTGTAGFGAGESIDITATAKSFLIIINDGDMNTVGEVRFSVKINDITADSDFSITIQPLIVPVMNFSTTPANPANGWILHEIPGEDILLPMGENLIPSFGPVGAVLPKASAAGDFKERNWIVHGNAANMTDPEYQGIVQNSELVDGRIRQVLRFNKGDGSTGNSGPMIRVPVGSMSGEQWYYINTWLRLVSGTLSLGETNEYRISIYNTLTTAITTSPARSKIILGGLSGGALSNANGRVVPLTGDGKWHNYSFLVCIPDTFENRFLEIRLFVPNSENAVTVDMTDVEMIAIPAP
ncbi:MAG: hypothetical protein FWD21_03315, partial [Peptococcaceae bacterium]|nr:hypothetical protein [Peptococcaceae bacterium]